MHTPEEIRTIEFQKSMSGYKTADVEIYLDELADQIESITNENSTLIKKIDELNAKIESDKIEKDSLQNILISAQVLADKIVSEAKDKAEELIKKANDEVIKIEDSAAEKKAALEKEHEELKAELEIKTSNMEAQIVKKTESMLSAAKDSVNREQLLFDKLKISVATMKKELVGIYKQQLELVTAMPDEVPFDAEHAAAAITIELEKSPDYAKMVKDSFKENKKEVKEEVKAEKKEKKEAEKKESEEEIAEENKGNMNFSEEKQEDKK